MLFPLTLSLSVADTNSVSPTSSCSALDESDSDPKSIMSGMIWLTGSLPSDSYSSTSHRSYTSDSIVASRLRHIRRTSFSWLYVERVIS